MKPTHNTKSLLGGLALSIALFAAITALTSCVSTITTTTAPDGTVTVTEVKGVDAASVNAASLVATEISRARQVTADK